MARTKASLQRPRAAAAHVCDLCRLIQQYFDAPSLSGLGIPRFSDSGIENGGKASGWPVEQTQQLLVEFFPEIFVNQKAAAMHFLDLRNLLDSDQGQSAIKTYLETASSNIPLRQVCSLLQTRSDERVCMCGFASATEASSDEAENKELRSNKVCIEM